jgi:hypothetical protein
MKKKRGIGEQATDASMAHALCMGLQTRIVCDTLLFHCSGGCTNECQCYVILPCLSCCCLPYRVSICAGAPCYRRVEIMRFQVAHESPDGIVRLAATFVKYVWATKITQ